MDRNFNTGFTAARIRVPPPASQTLFPVFYSVAMVISKSRATRGGRFRRRGFWGSQHNPP